MLSTNQDELELCSISKRFGGIVALDDISIGFERGQVTCIIGPNGAGKTTLFNVMSGLIRPDSGKVLFKAQPITCLAPHRIAQLGIGRLFQDVRVFGTMSVLDNVAVGAKSCRGESPFAAPVWPYVGGDDEKANLSRARDWLAFVGLDGCSDRWADQLSYGQQKLLAIARLLNSEAECFLLDEPTSGVEPGLIASLLGSITRLAQLGKTVVVIEHNLGVVRDLGNWVFLMASGRVEAFGSPSEILRDSALVRLFPSL